VNAFASPATAVNVIASPASVVNPVNDLIDGLHTQSVAESAKKQSSIFSVYAGVAGYSPLAVLKIRLKLKS